MKKNLFEMGSNFEDTWTADNKNISTCRKIIVIKPPNKHQLHFSKEKRRGKVVTIIKPFYLEKVELQKLLKYLKKKLGAGGTIKEDTLEFQGEKQSLLKDYLLELDYRFKS